MSGMDELTYDERSLLNALFIRYDDQKPHTARVYNARPNYRNLTTYRALERAGYLTILSVTNDTTENMLYGMSVVTYALKGI